MIDVINIKTITCNNNNNNINIYVVFMHILLIKLIYHITLNDFTSHPITSYHTACFFSQYSVAYSSFVSMKESPISNMILPSTASIISVDASSSFSRSSVICFWSAFSSNKRLFNFPNSFMFS